MEELTKTRRRRGGWLDSQSTLDSNKCKRQDLFDCGLHTYSWVFYWTITFSELSCLSSHEAWISSTPFRIRRDDSSCACCIEMKPKFRERLLKRISGSNVVQQYLSVSSARQSSVQSSKVGWPREAIQYAPAKCQWSNIVIANIFAAQPSEYMWVNFNGAVPSQIMR